MGTIEILYGVIAIQSFLLLWFGKMLYAQKSNVDTSKATSEGVKNFQDMLLTQYKPETFENFAKAKEREFELKYQDIIGALRDSNKAMAKELQNLFDKHNRSYYRFISMCAFFKLFDAVNFETLIQVLQFEKPELDEIEMIRKKIIEGSKRLENEVIKAGGKIVGQNN